MRTFLTVLAVAGLIAAFPSPLSAQTDTESRRADVDSAYICILHSEDVDAMSYTLRDPAVGKSDVASADIVVSYVNEVSSDPWPEEAKNALNYAASIWAGIVSSNVTIRIQATWADLGNCDGSQFSLASTGPQFIYRNFTHVPKRDTWYPDALADAIARTDLGNGKEDILSKFNRRCGPSGSGKWYLGTDGRPPSGTIDLATVAIHEFAHGLGIFGSANVDDGESSNGAECDGTAGVGCIGTGNGNNPLTYDQFTEDGNGTPLLSLSNPSATLATALEGGRAGGIFFSGPMVKEAGFSRARLYAPATFNLGTSYAHLDENTYNHTPEALMTPFLARAESIHVPGALACGMLADIGWTISGDCTSTTTATESVDIVPQTLGITGPYPNPLRDGATLIVSAPSDGQMNIDVVDVLGRPVARLFSGELTTGDERQVQIDGSKFPAGVYILAFTGDFGTTSRTLIVVN